MFNWFQPNLKMACDFMKNIGEIALDRMNTLKQKLNEINQEQTRIR